MYNNPQLVLSSTATFFSGNIEAVFKKAKKYGFKYVEIIPYKWNTPEQILEFQKKYNVQIAGIHMPPQTANPSGFLEKIFSYIWKFYLGDTEKNPGTLIATALKKQNPYVLIHADVQNKFPQDLHIVIENVPYNQKLPITDCKVFDHSHFKTAYKSSNAVEAYKKILPEIIHIGYDYPPLFHILPHNKELNELKTMLKIYKPKYMVIETNPLISIKRAKEMFENLLSTI